MGNGLRTKDSWDTTAKSPTFATFRRRLRAKKCVRDVKITERRRYGRPDLTHRQKLPRAGG
ncbi:hypothetical protein SHO565_13280 [Streptomyces sp. HO565]